MDFRIASIADAIALARMNWQLIRDEGHRNQMSIAELDARMAGWLEGEYSAIVFIEAGETVGYALFRQEPQYVYLRQFFVEPRHRRRGLGRAAIEWLHQNAWNSGRVRVEVLIGNTIGLSFWRAVGFEDYCLTLEMTDVRFEPSPSSSFLPLDFSHL